MDRPSGEKTGCRTTPSSSSNRAWSSPGSFRKSRVRPASLAPTNAIAPSSETDTPPPKFTGSAGVLPRSKRYRWTGTGSGSVPPETARTTANTPTTPASPRLRGFQREPPRAAAASTSAPYPGSSNAATNAPADPKRSAGTFSRAVCMAAATFRGTEARCSVTGSGASASTRAQIACIVGPLNGGAPASISYRTHPSA